MKIINLTRGSVLMAQGKVAAGFFSKLAGLQFRQSLAAGEGLILTHTNSIHCFFMRFPIDVAFVSKEHRVVYIYHALKPWHISKIVGKASYTVEVEAGVLARSHTQVGDLLQWQDETLGAVNRSG